MTARFLQHAETNLNKNTVEGIPMGASYAPFRQSRATQNRKPTHAGASESKIGLEQAKKSSPLRVPPGKIVQAQALLVQGHSQREIGRTLHISPMTWQR
jgi:hypothetical protein